ncbi:hypothetical protein FGF1_40730 [Flavobacteriaceae bacterium GF1]
MKTRILLLLVTALLLSCNESKKWRQTVDANVKKLTETVDQAAKAIPGERWQRILDGLHSDNPEVRQKALNYLDRVTGIDGQKKYSVSVWFDYDSNDSIQIDIFQEKFLSRDVARERLEQNRHRLAYTRRSVSYPLNINDLRDTLNKNISEVFENIIGIPTARKIPNNGKYVGPSLYNIRNVTAYYDVALHRVHKKRPDLVLSTKLTDVRKERKQNVERFVDNILLTVNQFKIPLNQKVRTESWNPLEGKGYLYILIKQKDFDRVKENTFNGYIKVHENNSPNEALYSPTDVKIEKFQFNPEINQVVTDPYTKENYVWYAHDMTGSTSINLLEIQKLGELLEDLEELKTKQKKEDKSWW